MPPRHDPDASRSEKALRLFAKLFFNPREYSLIELSQSLGCSKQTVSRLVDTIELSMGVSIERTVRGRRKFYRLPRRHRPPDAALLSADELKALSMCHAFTETLLGREIFDEATRGLEKTVVLLPGEGQPIDGHFSTLLSGHIDYSPHQATLRTLIEAMERGRVCKVGYRRLLGRQTKTFHIKPLKIFSYRDSVYVHAKRAKEPGRPYEEPKYDPLLAVHRIRSIEVTGQRFRVPDGYDFDQSLRQAFGVWQNAPFEVCCAFRGWAAEYVAERRWSADQRVEREGDETVVLTFTARGEPEVLSWILGFGEHAEVRAPRRLVEAMRDTLGAMLARHVGSNP